MTLDLSNRQERRQAQEGVAETMTDEIIPCLFHDADQRAWARLPHDDHYETFAIDSREIITFLQREFWERTRELYGQGMLMEKKMIADRLKLFEARARFDGPEEQVFLRVGENDRTIYIDLCDRNWRTVRISPDGWQIEDQPPVYFRPCRRHEAAANAGTWRLSRRVAALSERD